MPDLKDIILGNVAVERGVVDRNALSELLRQQKENGLPLGQVMLRAGLVTGPRLIELMKLVNVTISHLDGGMEVGLDEGPDHISSPPAYAGRAPDPPYNPNEIPVVPVVGGARPQPPVSRPGMPAPRPGPAPIPSPLTDATPILARPAAAAGPAAKPPFRGPASTPGFAAQKPKTEPLAPSRPKTEAFTPSKPKTEAFTPSKPKTEAFVASTPKTEPFNPNFSPDPEAPAESQEQKPYLRPRTEVFDPKRAAAARTKTEAFRMQLGGGYVPAGPEPVQGAFGETVSGGGKKKKDATLLHAPADVPPAESPAGKLDDKPISLPPMLKQRKSSMPTPAGILPQSVLDRETGPIPSPLDDSKVIPPKGDFEMPPGSAAETSTRPGSHPPRPSSKPPIVRPVTRAPSTSAGIPGGPATGRLTNPEDSGFVTKSDLPDFEVRLEGGKAKVMPPPKDPVRPHSKGTSRSPAPGKGSGLRAPLKKDSDAKKPEGAVASKDGKPGEEEPKKRGKKFLVFLLTLLVLILGGGGTLFYFKKVTINDFKQIDKAFKQAPDLLRDSPELVKEWFRK